MKAWQTLIVACAALAIAASPATATLDRSLPSKAQHAKITKKVHHKRVTPKIKITAPRVLISRTVPASCGIGRVVASAIIGKPHAIASNVVSPPSFEIMTFADCISFSISSE